MQGGQEREPETDRGTHRQHREGAEWREERKRERGKKRTGTVRERERIIPRITSHASHPNFENKQASSYMN